MPKPTIESHATVLLVEDLDAPYAELLKRGADVIHGPVTQGYGC